MTDIRSAFSLGGRGIPLVFLHGLGLSRRAYLRLLSRVADLGFLVVAVDTAGHRDTHDLPCDAGELSDRVDLVIRTQDIRWAGE
jgi:pimeloyl-ACP methyl ester carboxylesterase